ncbi:MAG: hypothetical protein JWP01_1167 [Myxococcales bacterium]|nr:hypothetical protein [Myxococcales bacterium]
MTMRTLVVSTLAVLGCGGGSSAPSVPASYRFLPPSPELVVRLDLARARTWPQFPKLATQALAGVQRVLDDAKTACNLDLVGEAKTVVLARTGPLVTGDTTLIVDGIPRAKIASCLSTISKPGGSLQIVVDGDVFQAEIGARAIASGAWLPSGETVLVMRAGQGVEPTAWKTEVTKGAVALPAWAGELDARAPIAVRVVDPSKRTIRASVTLADPLVIKGVVVDADEVSAKDDATKMKAIAGYLSQANAGTGRVEQKGTTIHADFTAAGPQIDAFLTTALPAVFSNTALPIAALAAGGSAASDPGAPSGTTDCTVLGPAVEAYIKEGLAKAPEAQRKDIESALPKLVPALQSAFVDTCKADSWSAASIDCHIKNATALSSFEKCRQTLTTEQREHLDKKLAEALSVSTRVDTQTP